MRYTHLGVGHPVMLRKMARDSLGSAVSADVMDVVNDGEGDGEYNLNDEQEDDVNDKELKDGEDEDDMNEEDEEDDEDDKDGEGDEDENTEDVFDNFLSF